MRWLRWLTLPLVPILGCSAFRAGADDSSALTDAGSLTEASLTDASLLEASTEASSSGETRFCARAGRSGIVLFCEDFEDDGDAAAQIGKFQNAQADGAELGRVATGKDGTHGFRVALPATNRSFGSWIRSSILTVENRPYELSYSVSVISSTRTFAVLGGLIRQPTYERYGCAVRVGALLTSSEQPTPTTPTTTWNEIVVRLSPSNFPTFKRDVTANGKNLDVGVTTDLQSHEVELRLGAYDTSVEAAGVEVVFDNVLFRAL